MHLSLYSLPPPSFFRTVTFCAKMLRLRSYIPFCFIPQFNCLWRVLSFSERLRIFPDNEEHLLHELQKGVKINSRPQCFMKHFLPKLVVMKLFDLWVLRYLYVFSLWTLRGNPKWRNFVLKVELVHKAWYHSKIRNISTFQISSKFCVWCLRCICNKNTSNL